MKDKKYYLDLTFMRLYCLSLIWTCLIGGIFMLVMGVFPLGIFVTLLGIGLMVATIYGRWFKVGQYPKYRVILLAFTGIVVLISAFSFRIFMNPPRDTYWLVYFIVAVILLLPPWIYLLQPSKNHEGVIKNELE